MLLRILLDDIDVLSGVATLTDYKDVMKHHLQQFPIVANDRLTILTGNEEIDGHTLYVDCLYATQQRQSFQASCNLVADDERRHVVSLHVIKDALFCLIGDTILIASQQYDLVFY